MAQPEREKILNVDDTEAARYAKTRILSRAGYEVIEAVNGLTAIERVRTEMPVLVLLDTKLPDISGFDVARRLKEDPATRTVLILQTSASYLGTADKIHGLENGADNYLFEPIESDELVANVRALLRLGRVERELRDVDRRKDEFLAVLAHELRNPLGPIRGAADFLGYFSDQYTPAQENARKMIVRQTNHMVRLIDDLLDVSRISKGKIALQWSAIALNDVIDAALETSRPNIDKRGHRLQVTVPEVAPRLVGDSVRLTQVVSNLLNNAAKFTPPDGELTLSVHTEDDQVVIRVGDSGIGIAKGDLTAIFELFEQAGHSADRVQDGLGIGLALVRELVSLHGGSVTVDSAGLGQGSSFEVRLYTVDSDAALDVCVVGDRGAGRDLLAALLGSQGHRIEVAGTAAVVRELVAQRRPQVLMVDLALPTHELVKVEQVLAEEAALAGVLLIGVGVGAADSLPPALHSRLAARIASPVTMTALKAALAGVQAAPV